MSRRPRVAGFVFDETNEDGFGARGLTRRQVAQVERSDDPTVWRPVTAWPCKLVEERALERRERT